MLKTISARFKDFLNKYAIISTWREKFYGKLALRPLFNSCLIIFLSAVIFGLWFKFKQLNIISPRIIPYYPLTGYASSVMLALLIFSALWLILTVLCLITADKKFPLGDHFLICSLPFTAFWLSVFNLRILYPVALFWLLSLTVILVKIIRNKPLFQKLKEPLLVLLILFTFFLLFSSSLSPLYHKSFFDAFGRIDFFLNFEHQWENAKAYDFIGNFTQQGKLGGYSQGIYMDSELSSFVVFLFDVPLTDLLGKYATIKFMFFFLYIFGSYGCYLLLRYGLRLSFLPSFIGGLGFILGNAAFLSFLGAEYPIHQVPLIFLPWILFFLRRAYSFKNPALVMAGVGIAGLVASLSEYTLSSHPEINLLSVIFSNLFNVYLALVLLIRNRFRLKLFPLFLINVAIFPFMHLVGLAYKFVPLFTSLLNREYALYDSNPYAGLPWDYSLIHWSTFFFRIGEGLITTRIISATTAPPIFFFAGHFVLLMIYACLIIFCIHSVKKFFKKDKYYSQCPSLENSFFFLAMALFLGINMVIGTHSWLSELMRWTGFLRVHEFIRMDIFYFFFALIAAMFGLQYMLNMRHLKILNIIFSIYILNFVAVYLLPVTPKHPKLIYMDIFILSLLYILFYATIKNHGKDKRKYTVKVIMVIVALISFFSIDSRITKMVLQKNNPDFKSADNIFTSFRTATVYLKNNQHDKASFNYLDQRINKFMRLLRSIKNKKAKLYAKKSISSDAYEESVEYYDKIKGIIKNNPGRMQLFEAIAPEIDNFYLNYGPMNLVIGASVPYFGPLVVDTYSTAQFYLPDQYNLIAYTTSDNCTSFLPRGKNAELSAGLFYGLGPAYPAMEVNFHLNRLYPDLLANKNPAAGLPIAPTIPPVTKELTKLEMTGLTPSASSPAFNP